MNRYMIICRLRWPSLLLLTGVIALLHQAGVMTVWHAWPLYLILLGVLALAERAALASDPAAGTPSSQPAQPASTEIVPAHNDLEVRNNETRADFRNSGEEEER